MLSETGILCLTIPEIFEKKLLVTKIFPKLVPKMVSSLDIVFVSK